MRLKPTERLILLSLQLTPRQTTGQLARSTDTRHRYRLGESIRLLATAGLIQQHETSPATYSLSEQRPGERDRGVLEMAESQTGREPPPRLHEILNYIHTVAMKPPIERTVAHIAKSLDLDEITTLENLDVLRMHGHVSLQISPTVSEPFYDIGWELPSERYFNVAKNKAFLDAEAHNSIAAACGTFAVMSEEEQNERDAHLVIKTLRCADLFAVHHNEMLAELGYGPGNMWLSELEIAIATGLSIRRVSRALSTMFEYANRRWCQEIDRIATGSRSGVPVYRRVLKECEHETVGQDIGIEVMS